jgi:nucleotide-binding universal stress UspA family protein
MTTVSTILVLLTAPTGAAAALALAAEAAKALPEPTFEVLHVQADPVTSFLPSEAVLTPERLRPMEAALVREGTAVHAAFRTWRAAGNRGSWAEVVGEPAEQLRGRAREPGLVVMTLPSSAAAHTALEVLLTSCRHPVLVVPADWTRGFGKHLAVGWHDRPSTRHALAGLRPWLVRAEKVTVLTVTDAAEPRWDFPLTDLPGRVEHRAVVAGEAGDAAALLTAAIASGADGLAMGAYGRGRTIEWLLGGMTEETLHRAALPLLLMH